MIEMAIEMAGAQSKYGKSRAEREIFAKSD
jgi:hypothetical protein